MRRRRNGSAPKREEIVLRPKPPERRGSYRGQAITSQERVDTGKSRYIPMPPEIAARYYREGKEPPEKLKVPIYETQTITHWLWDGHQWVRPDAYELDVDVPYSIAVAERVQREEARRAAGRARTAAYVPPERESRQGIPAPGRIAESQRALLESFRGAGGSIRIPTEKPKRAKVLLSYVDNYTVEDVQNAPNTLFVFGDNLRRAGRGGQAIIRDEPNAVGIPTKHAPSKKEDAFFTDADLKLAKPHIDAAFDRLEKHLERGKPVVFPAAGVGTGLAELPERAKSILAYIRKKEKALQEVAGYEKKANPRKRR